jgi:hypothetical protein
VVSLLGAYQSIFANDDQKQADAKGAAKQVEISQLQGAARAHVATLRTTLDAPARAYGAAKACAQNAANEDVRKACDEQKHQQAYVAAIQEWLAKADELSRLSQTVGLTSAPVFLMKQDYAQ